MSLAGATTAVQVDKDRTKSGTAIVINCAFKDNLWFETTPDRAQCHFATKEMACNYLDSVVLGIKVGNSEHDICAFA